MMFTFNANHSGVENPAIMDSDFEVVLSESAPCLDHLRWLLNQVTDLHVAAQSMHYEAKYTGDRLPHDLVERMTPPVEARGHMASRLEGLVELLEAMTEDISAAHQAVLNTLPKPAPCGGAGVRMSGR